MTIIVRAVSKKEFSIRLEGRYENKAEIYTVVFRKKNKRSEKCIASCRTMRIAFNLGSETNRDSNGKPIVIPAAILKKMKDLAEDMFRSNLSSYYVNRFMMTPAQLTFKLKQGS